MWKIKVVTEGVSAKSCTTLCFAAQELKKYLSQCTDEEIIIGDGIGEEEGTILLGVGLREELAKVKDAELDDAILIDVKGKTGVITGVNARSVLIGVYRYLTELGYSFVRPGKNGEKVPKALNPIDVNINEAADHRYRIVCIEGSVTYECIADMIDWLPKVGMNGYYTQFFTPMIFFQRWYAHKGYEFVNPYLKGEPLTVDDVNGMVRMLEREIEKRGVVYRKVGHGWTCDPFGMTSLGWDPVAPESIPKGVEKYFAQINGKREMATTGNYAYVPMIVQLCYGNPEVRERIISSFVDFCKNNPHIDCVAFSVADGSNAHCECELCRDTRPADFIVMMLNEIDRRLTELGIKTKIDFGIYVDTLWPPLENKIINEDRFSMEFCPISRTYTDAFPTKSKGEIGPFERNKLKFPSSVEELLTYYHEWRKLFKGDSIVFDYYYMWDCYMDLGGTDRSRVIMQDIKNYRDLDINGLISCQGQRVFCPTSLGMNVMARTLWNRESDFDAVRDEVLSAEFGEDFALVRDYLQDLSTYSLPEVTRLEKPFVPENIESYQKGIERVKNFMPIIDEHIAKSQGCEMVSWKYLKFHGELAMMLMSAFIEICKGADPVSLWTPIEDFVNRCEMDTKEYFDVFEFKFTYMRLVFNLIRKAERELNIGV